MASEGDLCEACFSGHLQLHEGMLVCEVCGSIHQGFAEETQEFQTGISDARFFKKSEGMGRAQEAKLQLNEPPPPPPVADAVRAYVQAIQQLLQRQAQALVSTCTANPALPSVLRELWLAFLAHSRLLEPATLMKLEALAEHASGGDSGGDSDGGEGGAHDSSGGGGADGLLLHQPSRRKMPNQMTHARRSVRVKAELAPLLHLRHTLALLLLACWQQQEAVGPLDVARWALSGQLPYLAFAAEEGEQLQQYSNVLGRRMFTPTGVPSATFLHAQACQVAEQLGLACPPLNTVLWLQRYLAELELAQELLPVALQLHSLYQPVPLQPADATRPARHAWAQLMAVLVVAVKLCYGLDGSTRSLQGLPAAPAWHDWAPRQLSRLANLSAFPLSLNEAVRLDGASFRAYLQYLQQGLFAGFSPPSDLDTVHQLLQRMALDEPAGSSSGGSSSGGAGGGDGSSAGGLAARPAPLAVQQQQGQGQQQRLEQQQQQLKQQHGYLFYGPGSWRKALFHPDYVMVLCACSPLVWLLPEALHELVGELERSLVAAECEVSYLYNSEEQARLARLREEGAWLRQQEQKLQPRQRRQQQRRQST